MNYLSTELSREWISVFMHGLWCFYVVLYIPNTRQYSRNGCELLEIKKITSSMWGICAHKSSSYCIFRAMPQPPLLSYTNNYMLIIINTTWTTYEFWRHANWLIFRREASPQRRPSWQQKTSKGIGGQLHASTGSRVFSMASIFWWMLRRLFSLAEAIHDKERSWQWMK